MKIRACSIIGGQYKTLHEAEENIIVKLTWVPFDPVRGVYCLEISREGNPWVKVYLSDNRLKKLHRKMDRKDSHHIVCPTKDPAPWPFGEPSDVYLTCTDEGYLEIVKTPEGHRFILEFRGEDLWKCERDEGLRLQQEAGRRFSYLDEKREDT